MENKTSILSGAFNYVRNLSVKHQLALFGGVTLLLTMGLSVGKLAKGIGMIYAAPFAVLIISAIVIDFGMVFCKAAIIHARLNKVTGVKLVGYLGLVAFGLMSCGFNCWSCCLGSTVWSFPWWMGLVLGCSVPFGCFVYAELIGGLLNDKKASTVPEDLVRLVEVIKAVEEHNGDKDAAAEAIGYAERSCVNRVLREGKSRYGLEPALN